ncbi:MAG: transporter [Hyphomonas sp.]|uniref:efflux RND transporter permease subunit n=2 Tax=Hyphomonas TaxID=85 RepID=UPI000C61B50E|nr:efflux RND transporter permease subunit [Hyphomonas sp.]MBB42053.1 transporter [Hyphomonas sp.]
MTSIVDGAIGRARMVLAILICAIIAGAVTYAKLPKEADPDIPIPFVVITVPLAGVTPEDAERLLVRPIEQEIQSIEGLKTFNGYGSEGAGTLLLEFEIDVDVDQAVLDVKDKVDLAKRFFPQDAREPVIQEFNASQFPVMVVNLYGEAPVRGFNDIAEKLQDKLERNAGILEARIQGQREDVLEIVIDPAMLETYNISYQEIYNIVSSNNQLVPAGEIDTGDGSFAVKVPGLIRTATDALNLPIKRTENAVVRLQDVAEIRRTYKDATGFATFNGKPAMLIEVVKRSGANVLDTANFVRETIAEEQKTWPSTVRATITSDTSEEIGNQLGQLQSSIVTAVLLVMIIVVAALGWRSALLVGISIPASFVMAFLLLGTFGFTINMMVMFGMVIAVGILVDGAIVVTEYADRKMAEGLERKDAYAMAGKRMFWPVVSSTLTTLAAFVPFLFWNSMPGKFMAYLPLTLICVLTASLVMALIFLPVLGSVIGARPAGTDADLAALAADADPGKATGWLGNYVRLVKSLIARPWMVTGVAIGSVILIFMWFSSTAHRSEFFLDIEPEQAFVFVQAQGALSAEEEQQLVKRAELAIADIDGIESISSRSGSSGGSGGVSFDGANDQPLDTIGRLLLDLATADGTHDGRKTLEAVRTRLQQVPGLRFQIQAREQGPPAGKDLQVALLSDNQAALTDATARLRAYVENRGDVREIDDTRPLPGIEYRLEVDRAEAGKYGLDVAQIGAAVQLVTNGILVGRYRPDDADDEVDIRVRFPKDSRSASAIDTLRVSTPAGNVPLNLFVDRVPAPRVSQIERLDGKRVYYVRGNAKEQGAGAAIVQDVRDWVDQAGIGSDVEVRFEGADEDTQEANEFFRSAALAALFMMAVILLWEFNNFWQVILTLSAVIISTSGVLVGIQLVLPYVSILMIGTGIVALAGIVVNNNIVLIDTYNRLRKDGRTPEEAAIATAAQRIRPILLTTGTTICGLLPMVFEMSVNFGQGAINFGGSEAEWWVQLATAVVFGLAFSTIMILLVTPVWLLVPYRTGNMIRRIAARIRGKRPADEVRLLQDSEPANDKVDSEKPDSALPAAE